MSGALGLPGLRTAAARVVPYAIFGAVPAVAVFLLLRSSLEMGGGHGFWDFHALWNAGLAVRHGRSPYPPADPSALGRQGSFVYPAPAAFFAAPLTFLSFSAAGLVFALLSIAALLGALWLVGVRDWRVFGVALLTRPALHSLSLGAISPFLALGLAAAWRWRDRRWPLAGVVAALIVLKVFLWPLLVWLAFTRRLAAATAALALAVVASLIAWAAIGFAGLRGYPHLLSLLSDVLQGRGYSLVALGLSLGVSPGMARVLAAVVGVACLALVAWRSRTTDADAWTFIVAIGAALALSPIVWLHYFTLLLVPVAIASPRLGPIWALPFAFWALGGQSTDKAIWQRGWTSDTGLSSRAIGDTTLITLGLALASVTLFLCLRRVSRARVTDLERTVRLDAPGARERATVQ
jgi:hypothetical protein